MGKYFLLLASVILICGCHHRKIESGLEVSKVPLHQRLNNSDHCVEGFRYYLTRPYVTVNRRLEVARSFELCAIDNSGRYKNELGQEVEGVLRSLDSETMRLFKLNGEALSPEAVSFVGNAKARATIQASSRKPIVADDEELKNEVKKIAQLATLINGKIENIIQESDGDETPAVASTATVPEKIEVKVIQETKSSGGGAIPSAIQVVYLPDFEEQMAIKHKNRLSSSKFSLDFNNGSQLSTVAGSFNSAEVPIKIAQTISTAIESAAAIASSALTTLPIVPEGAFAKNLAGKNLAIISTTTFIEPGMYRLQKQSEMQHSPTAGQSYLTELGLAPSADVQVHLISE
jgi:hypothetical protein